jgi:acetyl-CoA C-acetyltransferase
VDLGVAAARRALKDANVREVGALYVGNMLAPRLGAQQHLGALFADRCQLRGTDAVTVEAACCSGMAAFRAAWTAVAAGLCDTALVLGVEKMTDRPAPEVTSALATACDSDHEAMAGLSFVALNALLMRRYMFEFRVPREAFAPFVLNSHHNASMNPNAMLRFAVTEADYTSAKMIADPISLLDSAPVCDGAAALVLCSEDVVKRTGAPRVRVRATELATDTLALHDRTDPLRLRAGALSAERAFERAGVGRDDMDFLELHDAFSIMSVLSLEACGYAERGAGTQLGARGDIRLGGKLPLCTLGGLKGRGHPVGASGAYQLVEVVEQLRGRAGKNQLESPRFGLAQSIGGSGATVATTILEAG